MSLSARMVTVTTGIYAASKNSGNLYELYLKCASLPYPILLVAHPATE